MLYLGESSLVKFVEYKVYCWFAFLVIADYLSCQYKHYPFHLAM